MNPIFGRRLLLGATAATLAARGAMAQGNATQGNWPDRPIRFVVPFAAGGNTDVLARLYGTHISAKLGQPIVVENRSGASGAIGTEAVIRSRADGTSFLIGSPGSIVNSPLLLANKRFDPITDLTFVAMFGQVPMVIIVNPSLPVRTLPELVAFSKARRQGVTIGTSGIGGANHLPLELFKAETGANLVHVPYRGGGATLPDFVAGNVDGILIELSSVLDLHRDGRGRILGIAAPQRSPQVPEVPTFIEAGYKDFLAASFVGLFAPVGTPAPILGRIQALVGEAARDPEIRARLDSFSVTPPTPEELTTDHLARFLQGELAKARRAIEIAGLKPE
ncbi:tripartite tricarboxylate transporter substrate binding protein [Roseomonas frigidaquae]|uniref:Tripartite tricarboxylate transporter substrate binding protein n=1 Tax=Falsiroseomonas frigidaquae TaxID=487318 RepID=A0ABX1ETS4_9PROT|nr:tripartite tricarboxylate transporter substrate binding protein [Falsiroseomonas frigidaquae]NKE44036.1 tripartite tricarboxylate transporter substrate binding protein [Falsiroseomonas frigidaquae]